MKSIKQRQIRVPVKDGDQYTPYTLYMDLYDDGNNIYHIEFKTLTGRVAGRTKKFDRKTSALLYWKVFVFANSTLLRKISAGIAGAMVSSALWKIGSNIFKTDRKYVDRLLKNEHITKSSRKRLAKYIDSKEKGSLDKKKIAILAAVSASLAILNKLTLNYINNKMETDDVKIGQFGLNKLFKPDKFDRYVWNKAKGMVDRSWDRTKNYVDDKLHNFEGNSYNFSEKTDNKVTNFGLQMWLAERIMKDPSTKTLAEKCLKTANGDKEKAKTILSRIIAKKSYIQALKIKTNLGAAAITALIITVSGLIIRKAMKKAKEQSQKE